MGNNTSLHKHALKHVRLLDTEHQIYIGLDDKNKKYIRIGDDYVHNYYPLTMYSCVKNRLKYEFENDIFLIITKNNNIVTIKFADMTKNVIFTKNMEPTIVEKFTKIGLGNVSRNFDDIYDLLHDNGC